MKKFKLFSFLSSLLFLGLTACSDDNGFEQGSNYDYPFTFKVNTNLQGVQGIKIPLTIELEETGEIKNPDKNYTFSFTSSGQGTLTTDAGVIYNPDQKVEFQYSEETPFKINYSPTTYGNHSVIYKIKNSAGKEVTQTVNYTIEEGSYSVSVDEQNKEDYQGNEVSYTLDITENVQSTEPYQVSIQNGMNATSIKINNQVVQENSFVNLTNLTGNKITLVYNETGTKNPTIVVKNQTKTQSIPVNLNVLKYDITLNGFLKYKLHNYGTGQDQMIDITTNELKKKDCYEELLYLEGSTVTSLNPNNDISLYVGTTLNSIESVIYNNVTYPVNSYFAIDKSQLGNIKLKFKTGRVYGDEVITIKLKDNFGNESPVFSKQYLFYDNPTINNTSNDLLTFYKMRSLVGGYNTVDKIESVSAINITGNGKSITKVEFQYTVFKNYVQVFQTSNLTFNYSNVPLVDFAETINGLNWACGTLTGNSTWLSRLQLKVTNSDGTVTTKTIESTQTSLMPTN